MLRVSWVLSVLLGLSACAQQPSASVQEPRTPVDASEVERRAAMRIELAGGYLQRGQFNVALDEVKQALALKPDTREGLNLRALILAAMGELAAADETFRRTLTLYPQDPDTLHNMGWVACQQKLWSRATEKFDEALRQSTYRAPARTWLAKGVCEARADHVKAAEASLMRAFELDPSNPTVSFSLADVFFRTQQWERARFQTARVNGQAATASSLWLAAKIEHRLGNRPGVTEWGQRLLREFPQSSEADAFREGRFE
ncbi:type IV pilus biogenesis/stability protein PilW [Inhella gelatinilytica]|uniref:Type IV pilus biogenesis/stability protein PilW n=1 Tax=Inhella gelatinilytica TaxID=2795030 RepID=A0A931NDV3_9BURK|nr:type IV pilus biogenesis/stability protein PilW [Inhella gelatinilytica]MBH9553487.1 type IV pilus biogenesis/stability protein PilW [Inhella gelatinilytica]